MDVSLQPIYLNKTYMFYPQNGDAVIREVSDKRSSILWLWRAHNKANVRLSGDVTDDKAFPKEVCIYKKDWLFFPIFGNQMQKIDGLGYKFEFIGFNKI